MMIIDQLLVEMRERAKVFTDETCSNYELEG